MIYYYANMLRGVYDDIILTANKALSASEETAELLEYPEVQADKAYYLFLLEKYNALNALKAKLDALQKCIGEEETALQLIAEADGEEKATLQSELSSLRKSAARIAGELAAELGCSFRGGNAYCRIRASGAFASALSEVLYAQIAADLKAHGNKISNEKMTKAKDGRTREISFTAEGENALLRLTPLAGAHRADSEELTLGVTAAAAPFPAISEKDIKTDIFHASGAGGQNINKVETAVRLTHLPTGTVVVCQDERSQLRSRERAFETLKKRLLIQHEEAQKQRMERDLSDLPRSQITFTKTTMTDKRLPEKVRAFPPAEGSFTAYLDALIAQGY